MKLNESCIIFSLSDTDRHTQVCTYSRAKLPVPLCKFLTFSLSFAKLWLLSDLNDSFHRHPFQENGTLERNWTGKLRRGKGAKLLAVLQGNYLPHSYQCQLLPLACRKQSSRRPGGVRRWPSTITTNSAPFIALNAFLMIY